MRLIIDFIPNHTGLDHAWFQESRKGNGSAYADYYVWRDGKAGDTPPNNWLSVHGGSAWTKDPVRGQYYLHHFSPQQPELNLANPAVVGKLKEAMTFWLEQGVDGFRIDSAAYLVEANFTDEPSATDAADYPVVSAANGGHCSVGSCARSL